MALLFFGKQHTATEFGKVEKVVHCEKCSSEYKYTMFRVRQASTGPLSAASQEASQRAAARLQQALEKGVDPIPCPVCGHFQTDMVREARRRHLQWMNRVALWGWFTFPIWALLLIVINGTFAREEVVPWFVLAIFLLASAIGFVILLIVRLLLVARYHPQRETGADLFRKGYCGGVLLKDDQGNEVPAPEPLSADELESLTKMYTEFISCEECGQEYQDFSMLAPAYLQGVAPCPKCGRIQTSMFAAVRAKRRGPWATWPKMLMSLGDFLVVGALLFLPVAITAQTSWRPDDDPSQRNLYWTIDAGLLAAGAVLMLAGWLWKRNYDPNSQDRESRLAMAKSVSKTRAEVEAEAPYKAIS
jgi:hypothetical protein